MLDLASRLSTRVQFTTDGHKVYLEAVEGAFGNALDHAMLIKTYEGDSAKKAPAETRHGPAECTGSFTQRITGEPEGVDRGGMPWPTRSPFETSLLISLPPIQKNAMRCSTFSPKTRDG